MGKTIPQRYNESMTRYGYGYAFYEPESSLDVKPGACGYIERRSGTWHPMQDLTKPKALKKASFDVIEKQQLEKLRPSTMKWGPKYTETVTYTKTDLAVGASGLPAGIPVDAAVKIEFSLKSDFGAVLMCSSEVLKEGFNHLDPFRKWAKSNAERLLSAYPDIADVGFFIVATTHSAREIHINAWSNREEKVVLGFKAGVTPVGEIAPATEHYRAECASDWNSPECKGQRSSA
jgi:hypothetical protein